MRAPIALAPIFAALLLAAASCAQPAPSPLHTEDGTPIVGKIQLRDRVIDLTVDSFDARHEDSKVLEEMRVERIWADVAPPARTP